MWYEIFKFELKYRARRPETYLFFVLLFAFSIFGVDFIFQGVELGLVKNNAPIVIGKTMGAISGVFMILVSMIMGMPMIRDDQYQITHLVYTNPIRKFDLLLGRFLGSFLVLIIIFGGVPLGMMVGELLPWHLDIEMLPFCIAPYANSFSIIVLPILFFGAALFFVTGTLSRRLLVVYTQGIVFFVIFILTKAITHDYLQAVVDPFSLTTITQISLDWTVVEKNELLLPFSGVLLANKMLWVVLGILVMWIGYSRFNFSIIGTSGKSAGSKVKSEPSHKIVDIVLPSVETHYGLRPALNQFFKLSIFYCKSLLKETSFWAIVICGVIIILINSISLGTVYGVDSYPTTYLIVEELQEMSLYFFIIILLFYSGELYWKEHGVQMNLLNDATPISSLIILSGKLVGLIGVYIVLSVALILSGIAFQLIKGYYFFDLPVYFSGFFIEILPFLVIYTFAAFYIQALVNNKFLGILITLIFLMSTIVLQTMGYDHVLFNYGGGGLQPYSEMNGYGRSMAPYLWTKFYWFFFGLLILVLAALISARGVDVKLMH
ncbi:MAG: peptidase M1, partial [Bacteroidia bacterium]|nr:peptidase M1 [Bacteroidia bacterium]